MAIKTYKFNVQAHHRLLVNGNEYFGGDLVELDEDNPVIDGNFLLVEPEPQPEPEPEPEPEVKPEPDLEPEAVDDEPKMRY